MLREIAIEAQNIAHDIALKFAPEYSTSKFESLNQT